MIVIDKPGNPVFNLQMSRSLIESEKDNYNLYQYGPYLTMRNHEFFMNNYYEIKNPLLFYFIDMACILLTVESYWEKSCRKMKDEINQVLKRTSHRFDKYSDYVLKHGNEIITTIVSEQEKNHVFESAMLNYAPIVPYCGTIVKAEMSDLHQRDFVKLNDIYQTKRIMDQTIDDCLKGHIVELMTNSATYLITSKNELIKAIKCFNRMSDGDEKEINRWILNYRIAVYMKFTIDTDAKEIFNILNACNIIRNGGKINVDDVINTLGQLDS